MNWHGAPGAWRRWDLRVFSGLDPPVAAPQPVWVCATCSGTLAGRLAVARAL